MHYNGHVTENAVNVDLTELSSIKWTKQEKKYDKNSRIRVFGTPG